MAGQGFVLLLSRRTRRAVAPTAISHCQQSSRIRLISPAPLSRAPSRLVWNCRRITCRAAASEAGGDSTHRTIVAYPRYDFPRRDVLSSDEEPRLSGALRLHAPGAKAEKWPRATQRAASRLIPGAVGGRPRAHAEERSSRAARGGRLARARKPLPSAQRSQEPAVHELRGMSRPTRRAARRRAQPHRGSAGMQADPHQCGGRPLAHGRLPRACRWVPWFG